MIFDDPTSFLAYRIFLRTSGRERPPHGGGGCAGCAGCLVMLAMFVAAVGLAVILGW